MEKLNFSSIIEGKFSETLISVTNKTVFPPEPFTCRRDTVMRDRFFYVVQGKIHFTLPSGEIQTYAAGDILYLPRTVVYTSRWDTAENGKHLSVNFLLNDDNGSPLLLSDGIALVTHDRKNELFHLFSDLLRKWTDGSYGYRIETRALFYQLLYRLSVGAEQRLLKTTRNNIYKAIVMLDNNYAADLTVQELSEMLNVRECMFRRAFKAEKGMSPIKYRNLLRLKKAKEMLESGEFTVLETAMAMHFDDPGYFSKLFKRQFGVSPSQMIPK